MKRKKDLTYYSKEIAGTSRNHGWSASFDFTDGYIGINQSKDRVLLSPAQFNALIAFVREGKHQIG